jgi:hypothetical protein
VLVAGSDGTDVRSLPMGVVEPTTTTYPLDMWGAPLTTEPFLATALTGTATSTADSVGPFAAVTLQVTYSAGVTGSPATCTIQPEISVTGANFINYGTAIAIAPASSTSVLLVPNSHPYGLTNLIKYVFACGTYASAGTFTMVTQYSQTDMAVNAAEGTAGTANSNVLTVQGNASGIAIPATDSADNTIDAGLTATKGTVVQGLTGINGTTPTFAPAGVTLPGLMNQDGRNYANIAPPNPIHFYQSVSANTLLVTGQVSQSFYVTDWTVSAGTTAQEMKLTTCDAGTSVTWVDVYAPANGGATGHQITPFRVISGDNICCDPVGGTTGTCTVDGYNAP